MIVNYVRLCGRGSSSSRPKRMTHRQTVQEGNTTHICSGLSAGASIRTSPRYSSDLQSE
jgi:hypothetical protein